LLVIQQQDTTSEVKEKQCRKLTSI